MTWVIIGIIALVILLAIWVYNSLVRAKIRTDEAWSDITVQLKRRGDLIPNLIETVKGYAKHEKTVFDDVTKARSQVLSAGSVKETAKADNQFEQTLKSLFAVAESYPQLRASENFQALQTELTDTEDKIQAARRFYNGAVRDFNSNIGMFPSSFFAKLMRYQPREFFEVDVAEAEAIQKPAKVNF